MQRDLDKDRLIERNLESSIETRHAGDFRLVLYDDTTDGAEHIALVKGDVADSLR